MKRILTFFIFVVFLIFNTSTTVWADDKKSSEEINPVWEYLGTVREPSRYNPEGMEVVYAFDKASCKKHRSNGDFGFWLAKMIKAHNEIELVYTRVSKDKKTYKQVQSISYYLDGTLKAASKLDGKTCGLSPDEVFYKAQELSTLNVGVSNMKEMPEFPINANALEVKSSIEKFEGWICVLDKRASGLDSNDKNFCRLVTYAYNPEERLFYRGTTLCKKSGPTSYNIIGGGSQLFTYDYKLLKEENNKATRYISDEDADYWARFYYEFYRAEK